MDKQYILDNTVLLVRHGSCAYGLNTPTSDVDIKGVVCVGPEYYLGFRRFEQSEDFEDDQVRYNLTKFVHLAGKCNPNILEILFVDPNDILEVSDVGESLLAARDGFVSLEAHKTFVGYAVSQLKRIKAKYRWIMNPPDAKPQQENFYREPHNEIEMKLLEKGTMIYDKEAFRAAMHDWANYQRWLNERNPARKELEQAHGYDTKHAMHLVRLLRMGREIVETGKVIVKRPDREELLAIRNGAWTYDALVEWADEQMKVLDQLRDDYRNGVKAAPIRAKANQRKLEELVFGLLTDHWASKGWFDGTLIMEGTTYHRKES